MLTKTTLPKHLENKEVIILDSLSEAYLNHYDLVEDEFLASNDDTRLEQLGYSSAQIERMSEDKLQDLQSECRDARFLSFCITSEKIIRTQFGLLLIIQ